MKEGRFRKVFLVFAILGFTGIALYTAKTVVHHLEQPEKSAEKAGKNQPEEERPEEERPEEEQPEEEYLEEHLEEEQPEAEQSEAEQQTDRIAEMPEASAEKERQETESPETEAPHGVIAIDAGHQLHANTGMEPVGPGASEKKQKVSSGTSGAASGLMEYELTLQVAKKLKKALVRGGYQVVMIRETNDVDIPNSERANIANEAHADAFIRIHADGSENTAAQGAMTICPTADNPFCAKIYKKSKRLSKCIISEFVKATGCRSRDIWETDTMSGINWCQVPVTILEMGFMSNREEDLKMADGEYQDKMIRGIVNGINRYMGSEK